MLIRRFHEVPSRGQRRSSEEKGEGYTAGLTNVLRIILTNCFILWTPTGARSQGNVFRGWEFEWEIHTRKEHSILGPKCSAWPSTSLIFPHSDQSDPGKSKALGMVGAEASRLMCISTISQNQTHLATARRSHQLLC